MLCSFVCLFGCFAFELASFSIQQQQQTDAKANFMDSDRAKLFVNSPAESDRPAESQVLFDHRGDNGNGKARLTA